MANLWLDLKGPILADTVYVAGNLVAKDVTIALPAVNLVTADFKAMGTLHGCRSSARSRLWRRPSPRSAPTSACALWPRQADEQRRIEFRWVQDVKQADGSTKTEGCKAFLRVRLQGRSPACPWIPATPERERARATPSAATSFSSTGDGILADRPAQHRSCASAASRLRQGHPQPAVTRQGRRSPGGALYLSKGVHP